MKKLSKILHLAIVLGVSLPLAGCMAVASPAIGTLYTNVKGPIDADGPLGSKRGEACASSFLSLIATGDASISRAAGNGGISNVKTVEHSSSNFLGLIGTFCTIVRGD